MVTWSAFIVTVLSSSIMSNSLMASVYHVIITRQDTATDNGSSAKATLEGLKCSYLIF